MPRARGVFPGLTTQGRPELGGRVPEEDPVPGACRGRGTARGPGSLPGVSREVGSVIVLPPGSWWDWDVVAWDAGHLRLGAGYDLSYHHGLELLFTDPVLVACPSAFRDPTFRQPTPEEVRDVARQVGEPPAVLVAFEADAGGAEPASGLIGAGGLEVVVGVVYRYWHEDLPAGARLAPWVRPPDPGCPSAG